LLAAAAGGPRRVGAHLDDGRRVGEAGGLYDDVVKLVAAAHELVQDADEVAAHWGAGVGGQAVR